MVGGLITRVSSGRLTRLNGEIRSNKLGKEFFQMVRLGYSATRIAKALRAHGVVTSAKIVDLRILQRYKFNTVLAYHDKIGYTKAINRGGNIAKITGARHGETVRVIVRLLNENGETVGYSTKIVQIDDSTTLRDIKEETYQDDRFLTNDTNEKAVTFKIDRIQF